MKELTISLLGGVGIGCFLGILRFVLDDKWNSIPKALCRFCLFFWAACTLHWIVAGVLLLTGHAITPTCIGLVFAIPVTTVVANFSYVYIKNANL